MAWTAPLTWTTGLLVTASIGNTHWRDNLLETAPAKATTAGRIFVATGTNAIAERAISTARVNTAQTATSTTFTDLATAGPAVTVTTGTQALVIIGAEFFLSPGTVPNYVVMGCEVSGASAVVAEDGNALYYRIDVLSMPIQSCRMIHYTGLTAGSNTFTAKYRVSGGTGNWQYRTLTVIAL